MEPRLVSTQKEVDDMIGRIDADKAAAAETRLVVEKEEREAHVMAMTTKAIADDAERDLAEALPALEHAVACLSKLKKVCSPRVGLRGFTRSSPVMVCAPCSLS
jgi:dynein heavy chain, axonemal